MIYFNAGDNYNTFFNCEILIFTCFTGSFNAGLPLIFDREFGFLNRLLVEPIISKNSILFATIIFIIGTTMLQNLLILTYSLKLFMNIVYTSRLYFTIAISLLVTIITSSISLSLAFILIISLSLLFTSTALASLSFLPYWLQILSKLNILTYAIEAIRYIKTHYTFKSTIIEAMGIKFNLSNMFILLSIINFFTLIITTKVINNKLE